MKKIAKIAVVVLIAAFIIAASAVSYVKIALPDVGNAPQLKVERTSKRIERGKYLANHVTICIDCHSKRDWAIFTAPMDTTTIGSGGEKFDHNVGFPGEINVPNITPHNVKNWTDGELFRAITTGVKKDGSPIFPIMPYTSYGKMDKEDIYSIIAYIRTLPAKESQPSERKLDFPLNILVNTMPQQAHLQTMPSENDTLKYGAYLVNAAACKECHTQSEKGKRIEGREFAGGEPFRLPAGTVTSANITPDKETGIGNWTKELFIGKFKKYADHSTLLPVKDGDFQTIMPWSMYAGLKENDLNAMFAYLQTIKPIKNQVIKFQPVD